MKIYRFNLIVVALILTGVLTVLGTLFSLGILLPGLIIAFYRVLHQVVIEQSTLQVGHQYLSTLLSVAYKAALSSVWYVWLLALLIMSFLGFNEVLLLWPPLISAMVLGIQIIVFHYALNMLLWITLYQSNDMDRPHQRAIIKIHQHFIASLMVTFIVTGLFLLATAQLIFLIVIIPAILWMFWGWGYKKISST